MTSKAAQLKIPGPGEDGAVALSGRPGAAGMTSFRGIRKLDLEGDGQKGRETSASG
jgi:hypothetical protein